MGFFDSVKNVFNSVVEDIESIPNEIEVVVSGVSHKISDVFNKTTDVAKKVFNKSENILEQSLNKTDDIIEKIPHATDVVGSGVFNKVYDASIKASDAISHFEEGFAKPFINTTQQIFYPLWICGALLAGYVIYEIAQTSRSPYGPEYARLIASRI